MSNWLRIMVEMAHVVTGMCNCGFVGIHSIAQILSEAMHYIIYSNNVTVIFE